MRIRGLNPRQQHVSCTDRILPGLQHYRAPRWAANAHVQTVVASRLSHKPPVGYQREIWLTPDEDQIAVDHVLPTPSQSRHQADVLQPSDALQPPDALQPSDVLIPSDATGHGKVQLVLFHGLEGSSQSHYSLAMMHAASRLGWKACVVHFRGCGGLPNRQPRAYHSGDSAEIDWVLRRLRSTHRGFLFVVGISLGANALLKWLGEQGEAANRVIDAAAGVCAPQDLRAGAYALARGMNLMYMRYFLNSLIPHALRRLESFPGLYDRDSVLQSKTFIEFDEYVTAPLHGFQSAEHYWASSSCGPWLAAIRTPCLILNPLNDPFVPATSLRAAAGLHRHVKLAYPRDGGHVGFIRGALPAAIDWMPQQLCAWFTETVYG